MIFKNRSDSFGMLLHMHRGTPYIYEGEELGIDSVKSSKPKLSERFLKINFRSVKALPDYLFLKAL